jgi:parafibromin
MSGPLGIKINVYQFLTRDKTVICLNCSQPLSNSQLAMASTLQEWASKGHLKTAVLSDDGKILTLDGVSLQGDEIASIDQDGKSCQYSLASIFLQIRDPTQGLMPYRNACKKHAVADPIKATDKPIVVAYFVGSAAVIAPPPPPPPPKEDQKKSRKVDKKDRKSDKKRSSSGTPGAPPKKKEKTLMTTEQMLDNLNVVVGKREVSREKSELAKALSAEGFDLTPEMIQESTVDIMATEIPVGNSNSILRPAPNRDFQRVLDLYLETENRRKAVQTAPTLQRPYLVGKKPIIVLPKGLTPPVSMWNAYHLFQNSKFIPRDVLMKQGATKASIQTLVKHRFDIRRGGHELEFELMDNPTSQLGGNPKEWDRIVAVVSLGASWQFKDWPRGFSTPVDLFTKSFGFFIGLEGDKEPDELQQWAVQKGYLSRDKRSLDSVCFAKFWDGLEDRVVTKKPEFLPQKME